ncbi:hypothetical protein WICPIJ_000165 [Wickerhamomyces pijperi]|uniref:Uncharacterized protein n=1 Tax=Wickerhamomyces pijperi TaxID=599730 RepID=A0A9P8QHJ8_WICPI|nr:hypothetical protein WICPIJ_000165 [Wickerhamomyces pijperi]
MTQHQQPLNIHQPLPNLIKSPHAYMRNINTNHIKRGIPGVTSDAYHLGFFEDTTVHNMEPVVHTQYDALIDAMTWFLLILTVFVILTAILFGIREYSFAMRRRKKQLISDSNWSTDNSVEIPLHEAIKSSIMTPGGEYNLNSHKHAANRAYPELSKKNLADADSGLSNIPNRAEYDPESSGTKYNSDVTPFEPFAPIEVVKISSDLTPLTADDYAMTAALRSDSIKRRNRYDLKPRKIYSIKEILAMKPTEYNGVPLVKSEVLGDLKITSVGQAVRLSFPIQNINFDGAWAAENEISDVAILLTNELSGNVPGLKVYKKLALFKFIAIGANSTSLQNPNIFLPNFNSTMDSLIDKGFIFDILDDTNIYKVRELIDMVMQYCYAHWFYQQGGSTKSNSLRKQFKRWKFNGPNVQPHHAIFRYLTNMSLGLRTVTTADADTLTLANNKITFLMLHLIEHSDCHDYIGITPLLSQAIEFSESEESQILFYRCLYWMIDKHSACCMDHDFFTGRGLLKGLVQSGLYYLNPRPIRKYTSDVLSILTRLDPQYQTWSDEVRGGKIILPSTPRLNQASEYNGLSNIPRRDENVFVSTAPESSSTDSNTRTLVSPSESERTWGASRQTTKTKYSNSGSNTDTNACSNSGTNRQVITVNHIAPKATPGYFFRK